MKDFDDYDDIELLDVVDNKKKRSIPSDKTEVLDPVTVKSVVEKKIVQEAPVSKYATKVEVKKEEKKVKKTKEKKVKDKTKKPAKLWEKIFWCISTVFILGCCVFYGKRLIHYYKIYNPKDSNGEKVLLLGDQIPSSQEILTPPDLKNGEKWETGLYNTEVGFVYKGDVTNNYIKYNNLLWRIVKINPDGTMVIILDDEMTMLPWNSKSVNYKDSDIHAYLNEVFLDNLDKSYLVKNSFCEDSVESITSISCKVKDNDSYVTLLDISSFLNTIIENKKSYLVSEEEIYWLNNYSEEKIWHTNGANVSQSDANSFYGVRPVVKLKSTIAYISGDGTKEKPYLTTKEDSLSIGSKVKLGDDMWVVYDTTKGTRLMLEKPLTKTYRYDLDKLVFDKDSKESLAEYLNTTYLDNLSYKDLLKEDEWVTGGYTSSYKDFEKVKAKAKVAVPSLMDYQYDSSIRGYFTTTTQEEYVLVYDNPIHASKVTISRGIRPCISLTDDAVKKLKLNDGVYTMGE